jgi:hypothetical protein
MQDDSTGVDAIEPQPGSEACNRSGDRDRPIAPQRSDFTADWVFLL